MKVTFTKMNGRRYHVAIERENGPELVARQAPGYDAHLPHDVAHLLVELEFGIRLGVFGQLAAGGEGVFTPAPADRSTRSRRTAHRIAEVGRSDMARSERLVNMCVPLWEARCGRKPKFPAVIDMTLGTPFEADRAMHRFDEAAARWESLAVGESMSYEWPESLTFRLAGSPAGRRPARGGDRRVRVGASH
ncbi:MAG TPA: hypothetical protein VGJ28_21020 [Micromonosporaceae bacterium]|jgi:hypothetical protein